MSPSQPLTDAEREKVAFLVDSWLYAAVQETTKPVSSLQIGVRQTRRPMTLLEKIFTHHVLPGGGSTGVRAGDVIRVSVDWVLASEISWVVLLAFPWF